MKKINVFICLFLIVVGLQAQDEAVVIESSAHVNFDGAVKLVLNDISLTNEGNLDVQSGEIVVSSTSGNFISTNQSLYLNTLTTADNAISLNAEGAFEVLDLNIASTDEVIFSDTSSLTLNGDFNAVGDLTMESGAALWIKATITETAMDQVNVQRVGPHNSSVGKYSIYGSPMTESDFSVLGTNAQSWTFEYDESTNGFNSPSETMMTVGKGYFVAFPGDTEGMITFSGTPQYKNLTYSVTRTDQGSADNEEGFNLLANPFTCPLDFDTFISESSNQSVLEESTIWIWDDATSNTGGGTVDDYLAINYLGASSYDFTDSRNGGSSKWDGTINVGQGFFVKAEVAGTISFKQNMKTLDGNDDDSFYRSVPATKYWFNITDENETISATTMIGFLSEATYGKDYLYDASRFGSGLGIYSLIDNKPMAIQGMPDTWLNGEQEYEYLPIGFNVPEAGNYHVSLAHAENNPIGELYLHDHLTSTVINLLNQTYTFSSVAGSINDRFSISLSPFEQNEILETSGSESNILVYAQPGKIILDAKFSGEYRLFNLEGKLIQEDRFPAQKTEFPISPGLYLVTIQQEEGINTYKLKVL